MHTTEEIGSGLSQEMWATPNTMDHLPPRSVFHQDRNREESNEEQLWPTPQATMDHLPPSEEQGRRSRQSEERGDPDQAI